MAQEPCCHCSLVQYIRWTQWLLTVMLNEQLADHCLLDSHHCFSKSHFDEIILPPREF